MIQHVPGRAAVPPPARLYGPSGRKRRGPALAALLLLLAGACQVERDDRAPGAAVPDTAAPAERLVEVEVYFTRDEQPVAVGRLVPAAAPLRGALQALLAGPTPEERARGLWSWFSEDTAAMLRSVNLAPDGRATVDFGDLAGVIPGASTSTGSHLLLLDLNRTVFQFPQVSEVEYRMEGSCDAFWNWLQRDCDTVGPASDTVPPSLAPVLDTSAGPPEWPGTCKTFGGRGSSFPTG